MPRPRRKYEGRYPPDAPYCIPVAHPDATGGDRQCKTENASDQEGIGEAVMTSAVGYSVESPAPLFFAISVDLVVLQLPEAALQTLLSNPYYSRRLQR